MNDLEQVVLWVVIYLALALLIVYIVFCGDSPENQHTCIGRSNRLLTETVPQLWKRYVLTTICGRERAGRCNRLMLVGCEKYVMPICYHLLVIAGLYIAQTNLMSRVTELDFYDLEKSSCALSRLYCIESVGVGLPPRPWKHTVGLYYVICMVSWIAVFYNKGAGVIKPGNLAEHLKLYDYDNLLFQPGQICRTCKTLKPARSKHCSVCNECVARFDHHCGWMGCCIGFYNIRYFIYFLSFHSFILIHGSFAAAELVRASVNHLIYQRYAVRSTGELITSFSFKIAFAAEPTVCGICIAFALLFFVVLGFTLFHLSLVWRNTTTNEDAKWAAIRSAETKHFEETGRSIWDDLRQELQSTKENNDSDSPDGSVQHHPQEDSGDEDGESYVNVFYGEDGKPRHIFNRGPLNNLYEVFAPHRYFRSRMCGPSTSVTNSVASDSKMS